MMAWLKDWLHERRIRRLGGRLARLLRAKRMDEARAVQADYILAINARSEAQVRRMERRMMRGLQ